MGVGEKNAAEQSQDDGNAVPVEDVCIGEHQSAGGYKGPTVSKQFPIPPEKEYSISDPLRDHGNNGVQGNE